MYQSLNSPLKFLINPLHIQVNNTAYCLGAHTGTKVIAGIIDLLRRPSHSALRYSNPTFQFKPSAELHSLLTFTDTLHSQPVYITEHYPTEAWQSQQSLGSSVRVR